MSQAHFRSIVPQTGGVSPIDDKTVAYFPFDEHPHDTVNGVRPIGYEKCFQFNTGEVKDYIETSLVLPENGTIELWYYPYRFYDYNTIWENSIHLDHWECWIYAEGELRLRPKNSTPLFTRLPSANQWYHIAFTWQKVGTMSLYLNGVLQQSATTDWVDPGALTLGGKGNTKAEGKMSDVRVWNYARTANQIEANQLYLNEVDSGLIAHWKLDKDEGPVVLDASGNGHDGLRTGGSWVEGRSIYSLAKHTEKDRGVLIERQTTNLLKNPLFTTIKQWTIGAGGDGDSNGAWGHSFPQATYSSGNAMRVETVARSTGGDTYLAQGITTGIEAGKVYTFSVYIKGNDPGTNLMVRYYSSSGSGLADYYSDTLGEINQFKRLILTTTAPANATRITIYVRSWGQAVGEWVQVEAPQLEEGTHATSFVETTRGKSYLAYPKELINPTSFSFSAWVNLNVLPSVAGRVLNGLIPIFEISKKIEPINRLLFGWFETNELVAYRSTQNTAENGGLHSGRILTPQDVGQWGMYTLTYDGTTYKMYVNGELVLTRNASPATYDDSAYLCLGGYNHGTLNGQIDDVRIDNVARTPEEIQAWYHEGRKGW